MIKNWPKPFYVFLLLSLLFFALIGQILNHCHPYNDLGIYGEALRLIDWNHLNPFIPGRFIHIFNDHFDPILIPFSFFERWIPGPILGVTIEWLTVALCWFPIRHLYLQQKINLNTAIFSYAFIILNHAMVDALFRPFHPTTWACLPLLCTLCFYLLENYRAMIVSLLVLFSCREEFPLVGITLGLVLLIDKKWFWSMVTLMISIAWTLFAFKIRPSFFEGNFSDYGGGLLHNFLSDPLAQLKSIFQIGTIRMFLARTIPLLLLLKIVNVKKYARHILLAFIIGAPIFGIRFAANAWAAHYGTAPVILFWFMMLPALNESLASENNPLQGWRIKTAWGLLLIIFLSPVVKNTWDNWLAWDGYEFGHKQCLNKTDRLQEIEKAEAWVAQSHHRKVLLSNNLVATEMNISHLLLPREDERLMEFYSVGGASTEHPLDYEVVLVEKPPSGDSWPIGNERTNALIEIWRKSGLHVITDNNFLFLAEGVIKDAR